MVTCSIDKWPELFDDDSRDRTSLLSEIEDIDLVCAPDLAKEDADQLALQRQILAHCDRMRDRFAILDARAKATSDDAASQWSHLVSPNGALYFPWIRPHRRSSGDTLRGHKRLGASVWTCRRRLRPNGPSRGGSQGAGERAHRRRRGHSRASQR